jgi:starvation-inducible DNA-binding protein
METLQETTPKKAFKKLGFTYLDTAEIVVNLKQLLADYHVHYQKLRNFHWNIEGADFFELHEEFENEYNAVKKRIDIIAERIRVFGQSPAMSLQEILKNTTIKESKGHETSREMVKEILSDYGRIHETLLESVESAIAIGDVATEQMITDMVRDLEKRHWMFTAWMK